MLKIFFDESVVWGVVEEWRGLLVDDEDDDDL